MKTAKRIILAITVICTLSVFLAACGNTVTLESLKTDNEFQYSYAPWRKTAEEVEKELPYAIEKSSDLNSDSDEIITYVSKDKINVDGKKANVYFQFGEDGLMLIQISIEATTYDEAWFNEMIEKARELYGGESEKKENADGSGPFNSVSYKWNAENSRMNINWVKSNSDSGGVKVFISLCDNRALESLKNITK